MADEKKVPYIVVNYTAKTFTINDAVKPTKQDEEDIQRYLQSGYKMRHKSAKRVAQAKGKALTDAQIVKALEDNAEALAEYNKRKKDTAKDAEGKRVGGFFAAKKWYEEHHTPEGIKRREAREKEEARKKAEAEAKK